MPRPECLSQGERARLFPVLATTSKEGRTTSIFLACFSQIEEFRRDLLISVGEKLGKRSTIETFTEVVFKSQRDDVNNRPDGLIVVRNGAKQWTALVESKIGKNSLYDDQIEKYRALAKENGIDCVVTISNQFATTPLTHPLDNLRKSRSKIPVYHWSWMYILTTADLLVTNKSVSDGDQNLLLNEFRRFLTHESAGVQGFDRMPAEWGELNKHISAGGTVSAKSPEATAVLEAWHQETKDLSLILSRQTETPVIQKLSRKHAGDSSERQKDEMGVLREKRQLVATFEIANAAAPLQIVADILRRTIDVGMFLRAPEDRKSSKARVNWLIRQVRSEKTDDLFVRLNWPGRSEDTQFSFSQLRDDPAICEADKGGLQVVGFHLYFAKRLGARFTQQVNFITDLEAIVPEFYREIGQNLSIWRQSPPRIKEDRQSADEVDVDALAEDAEQALDT